MSSAFGRIYMDNLALDGEINSKVFPLADMSQRDYPINESTAPTTPVMARNASEAVDVRTEPLRTLFVFEGVAMGVSGVISIK
ncbi:hypothetical protein DPMN_178506, partial [Dreissena polymorpha]